jgi:hypothetical protein
MNKKHLILYGSVWSLAGVFFLAAAGGAFNDEGLDSEAAEAIKTQHPHITPTEVGGYGWFDCEQNSIFRTKFKGVDQDNNEVSGVVCETITGAKTIRFH